MFHVTQKVSKGLWAPVALLAVVISLLSSTLFLVPSAFADETPKGGGCVGDGVSTGLSSPFSQTQGMCLGDEASTGRRFFQFAVKLEKAVSGVSVSAKNGNGTSISFVKQSDTLYVSQPDSKSMGYAGYVLGGNPPCNTNDKNNIITISTKGPSNTVTNEVNLCSYKGDSSQSLVYQTASNLQDAGGGATSSYGTIKGKIGIQRTDPLVADRWKKAFLNKDYVVSIELTGGASQIGNYTLTNGDLTIGNIKPGKYTLKFVYNDKAAITADGGTAEWTSSDIAYEFKDIVVTAGRDTWLENSNQTPYYLATGATGTEQKQADDKTSCAVEGVGWIICPITTFIGNISDGAKSVIDTFLVVNVKLLDTNSGTYKAWSAFRSVANVAFVIVFIVIIYSQLTGAGISNYGIKKTLPRLIVAAILVNVSFFVCQLAVDITQIIGASAGSFLQNIPIGASSTQGMKLPTDWGQFLGDVLAGTGIVLLLGAGVAIGATVLALSISLPLLLAFLLAALMTVIILVGRQAGIVILIVLSPLAFVAFLLPNTEQWFKKWQKMFIALLMVYPIVSLLYGGGVLVSHIFTNIASSSGDVPNKFWFGLVAISISVLPLIMTPSILKSAMNSMGSVGGKLSGMASKANGKVRASANAGRYGEAKQGLKNSFALRRAERRGKSSFQKAVDTSSLGRTLGLDRGAARAVQAVTAEDDREVEAAVAQIKLSTNSVNRIPEAKRMLKESIKSGNATQARAAQRILLSSGNPGIAAVQQVYSARDEDSDMQGVLGSAGAKETMGQLRTELNSSGLKGKNNALATFGYKGEDNAGFNTHLQDAGTYTKLNPVELAGQSAGNLRMNQQHIDAATARAVLANNDAAAMLDAEKRSFFEERAGTGGSAGGQTTTAAPGTGAQQGPSQAPTAGATAAAGAATGTGSQTGGTVTGTANTPTQPTGNSGTQTASQRAQQTAQQAAAGSAGTTPFAVNSAGEATPSDGSISIPHGSSSNSNPPTPPATPGS